MAKLELRGLTRRYAGGEAAALSSLDLDVGDGELLVLVGPSGCGKSTALRIVAGLEPADGGTVTIDGRDITHTPPQDRDVAMVFQGYALYPHLTVRDNIAFPLRMRGVAKATQAERVAEAAALLGLGKLLDRHPAELSGGERQRVAMGRAIVRSPKAFLFDEPLSNLDAALRAELRVELASLVRRLGTTSIYVTHDQVEAMTMADRIAVMRAGTLQQLGSPRAIYERPANVFVAGFLGSPKVNLVELEVAGGRARRPGFDLPLPAGLAAPARVTAGVRPEHLALGDGDGTTVRVRATLVAAEPLGAETILTLDADGTPLRARSHGFDAPARGEVVPLHLAPSAVLWFDTETGRALGAEGGAP
jgi:multiple sugar transport system ATP-binding protein